MDSNDGPDVATDNDDVGTPLLPPLEVNSNGDALVGGTDDGATGEDDNGAMDCVNNDTRNGVGAITTGAGGGIEDADDTAGVVASD